MKLVLLDRFDMKYGDGAYDLLVRMLKDPLISLTDVGLYFGFSKQRASVYFSDVFDGISYGECFPRDRVLFRLRPKCGRYVSPAYRDGIEVLKRNGFSPELVPYKNVNRIIVNLFVVACCRLYVSMGKKTAHLMLSRGRRGSDNLDFYLCVLEGIGAYLIPSSCMPAGGISVSIRPGRSKYLRYLNNFEPLRKNG